MSIDLTKYAENGKPEVKLVCYDQAAHDAQLQKISLNSRLDDGTFEKIKVNEIVDDIMVHVTPDKANDFKVFVSNGMLGRIVERKRTKQIDKDISIQVTDVIFDELNRDGIRSFLNQNFDFYEMKKVKVDDQTYETRWVLQDQPPISLSNEILYGRTWNEFPYLEKIINHPIVTRKWEFINQKGYDPSSHLYLNENKTVDIEQMTVEEAYDELSEWLEDFPFKDDSDFCNALGLLFTIYLRTAFPDGELPPLFVITANSQGAGKSTLAQVLSAIVLGEVAGAVQLPKREEEMNKVIGSELILGTEVIVLDNVNENTINTSDALSSAISEKTIRFRLLGKSKMITAENTATYIMTGNNVDASTDLIDRACFIRLEVTKRAEDRDFNIDSILAETIKNRDRLFSAVHTIIKAWVEQGRPIGKKKSRFKYWAKCLSGIFDMLNLSEFLENQTEAKIKANPHYMHWCDFRERVMKDYGEEPWKSGDVFKYASFRDDHEASDDNFFDGHYNGSDSTKEATRRRRLGHYLTQNVGKIFGHHMLIDAGKKDGKNLFAFNDVNDEEEYLV